MARAKLNEDRQSRSAIMRAVKGRDTEPELAVRKMLWPILHGYRIHNRKIPGCPDIAFTRRKLAIFVHGCFWHGHNCQRGARIPKTHRRYWIQKISGNRRRDMKVRKILRRQGWRALVVWECELRKPKTVATRLRAFIALHRSHSASR